MESDESFDSNRSGYGADQNFEDQFSIVPSPPKGNNETPVKITRPVRASTPMDSTPPEDLYTGRIEERGQRPLIPPLENPILQDYRAAPQSTYNPDDPYTGHIWVRRKPVKEDRSSNSNEPSFNSPHARTEEERARFQDPRQWGYHYINYKKK